MGQRWNEVFANPFDQPGACCTVAPGFNLVGKDRSRRVGKNKFGFWRVSGKPGLQAAEGAAGADADDDGVDIPVELIVYFGRGSGGVRQRVGFVIELVNIESARCFLRQAARIILIIGRVALIHIRAGEEHFGSQGAEMENFLPAHFIGNHQRQGVIFLRGDQRQPQPGVTRRRFNKGTAGF